MILSLLSLAFLICFMSITAVGVYWALRARGRRRLAGMVLAMQGVLFAAVLVVLTSIPLLGLEPTIPVPLGTTLLEALLTVLVVVGVGAAIFLSAGWLQRQPATQRRRGTMGALIGVPLVAVLGLGGLWQLATPERVRERDPNKRLIEVPEGFRASVYVQEELDNPTTLAFGPEEELYIGDIGGNIWVARDANGDGIAETPTRFAEGFSFLTGVVWHEGELYVASAGKVEALADDNGDDVYDRRRTLVEGLPSMVLIPHTNNALQIGPDGRVYFGVGSTTSGEVEQNEYAAAILSVNTDGSDLQVFARGLSNSFDVAFNANGDMFAADNQPNAEVSGSAGDELNYVVEDGHYGYPYFFGEPPKEGSTQGPVANFPAHSSPNGLIFYNGRSFPTSYTDNLFIALWSLGEVNRVELAKSAGGAYLSRVSPFATGFVYPLDVTVGPDGSLYVADFGTSAIYRISYEG
jgi:putative membrane-bound dehydrogenase-like protein